ncbi:MAG: hypothetical protein KFF73_02955 [Cyclobacteriaceae bacterium]|nr:hypothetical protein [Cyclobacteriaceae bacterium]
MNYLLLIKFLILTCLFKFSLPVAAQLPDHQFVKINNIPEWEISPAEKKNLEIILEIHEGYHIQADEVNDKNLIPTTLTFSEVPEDVILYDPVYPEPGFFKLKNVDDLMPVFSRILKISIPAAVKKGATSNVFSIKGNLNYQACDSVKCYFPRDLSVNLMIRIAEN